MLSILTSLQMTEIQTMIPVCQEDDLSGKADDVNNKEYETSKEDSENYAGDDISKEWPQHEFAKRYMSFILINDVF